MATIGELLILMKADTASIARDFTKVRGDLEAFASGARKTLEGVFGGLGVGALVAGVKELFTSAMEYGVQMKNLAEKSGLSIESMSALAFAAKQSHVDLDALAIGIKRLNVNIAEGFAGQKEPARLFDALGLSLKDANGAMRPTEDILMQLADVFSRLPDGATKSALAVKLMGKSGTDMIPLLDKGVTAIKEIMAAAMQLGLVIGDDFAAKAEKMEQSLHTIGGAWTGLKNAIAGSQMDWIVTALHGLAGPTVSGAAIGMEPWKPATEGVINLSAAMKGLPTVAAETYKQFHTLTPEMAAVAAFGQQAGAGAKAAGDGIRSMLDGLLMEATALGRTTAQVKLYALEHAHASAAQMAEAQGLLATIKLWNDEAAAVARVDAARGNARDIFGADTAQWAAQMKQAAPTIEEIDADIQRLTHDTRLTDEQMQAWGLGLPPILEPAKQKMIDLDKLVQSFEVHAVDAFATAIVQGKGFTTILKQLLDEILVLITKMILFRALAAIIPGFGTAIGGTSFVNLLGFQGGGRPTPGMPIMVGEDGPEIFIPGVAGTILPNEIVRGGAGGMTLVQHNDLRGADASMEARINQRIEEMGRVSAQAAFQAYREFSRRTVLGTR
jgi:Phage-related minor tail protein